MIISLHKLFFTCWLLGSVANIHSKVTAYRSAEASLRIFLKYVSSVFHWWCQILGGGYFLWYLNFHLALKVSGDFAHSTGSWLCFLDDIAVIN